MRYGREYSPRMGSVRALEAHDVARRLVSLPNWSSHNGRLQREFKFSTFEQAFGFMTSVALVAQRMDHHPEFTNVYNRVSLTLWTHDVGGLSELDFQLAGAADRLAAEFANTP